MSRQINIVGILVLPYLIWSTKTILTQNSDMSFSGNQQTNFTIQKDKRTKVVIMLLMEKDKVGGLILLTFNVYGYGNQETEISRSVGKQINIVEKEV